MQETPSFVDNHSLKKTRVLKMTQGVLQVLVEKVEEGAMKFNKKEVKL